MDLQTDPDFIALDTALVSIAFDDAAQQQASIPEYGILPDTPLLVDADQNVSETYDVLQWAVRTGEPGHTFILVDENGEIAWIRDYGGPQLENPVMYVPPGDLVAQITEALQ